MTRKGEKFLQELLLLYVKYGDEIFREVLEELRGGFLTRRLDQTVSEVLNAQQRDSSLGPEIATQKTPKRSGAMRSERLNSRESARVFIDSLRRSTKEEDKEVGIFANEILERKILPVQNLLKDYLQRIGLQFSERRADRYSIAKRIASHLLNVSTAEARASMTIGRNMTQTKSSLAAWTNVIVKSESEK